MTDEIESNEIKKEAEDTNAPVQQTEESFAAVQKDTMIQDIKNADSYDFLPLFNLNIVKKKAILVVENEAIRSKVSDMIKERIEKRPDEMTMKDLLDCSKVLSEQSTKDLSTIKEVNESPKITLAQQNNVNVTINDGTSNLSRESTARVIDTIKEILRSASLSSDEEIQEPQTEDETETDDQV